MTERMDLYAELGVDRDSHADVIHAAYRRRAKTAHPDGGGSLEAFERLQLAHAVLTDPDRRRQYDATGRYDRLRADTADADALGLIGQLIAQFLGGDDEPAQLDLQKELLREAKTALAMVEKSLTRSTRQKKRAERLLGRFKTKDGSPTPVETMLRHQIAHCDQAGEKHQQAKTAFTRAIEILNGWTFDRELTLASQRYASALNQYAATRSSLGGLAGASPFTNGRFST